MLAIAIGGGGAAAATGGRKHELGRHLENTAEREFGRRIREQQPEC